MHKKLSTKFFNLFFGELSATILFALVWVEFIYMVDWAGIYLTSGYTIAAFILLEFILLQGSFYWYVKWKQAKRGEMQPLSEPLRLVFLFCKRINLFLVASGLVLFVYLIFTNSIYLYWYTFLYLFAVAELINYYYVRLSYQTAREWKELLTLLRKGRLKPSKLAKELH